MSAPTDVLGRPYTAETIPLADDAEGEVVATLVRRSAGRGRKRAVLHVHGFNDYFFQTGYADWWVERGYHFYALDLRKYGRSLRDHQTPNYIEDVHDYFEELDAAWQRIVERDHLTEVVVSAHSTGGLVTALWLDDRRPDALVGVVHNSPWLDMHGPFWVRTVGTAVVNRVGARQPRRIIRRSGDGIYGRSLHRSFDGEWDFDLELKTLASHPIYAGWLRAIRLAHAELHAGLAIARPVLVLTSGGSASPSVMGEDVHTHDVVLDIEQIRQWAPALGPHVTIVSIDGARHDVVLSRAEPRARVYDELDRWMSAYVER